MMDSESATSGGPASSYYGGCQDHDDRGGDEEFWTLFQSGLQFWGKFAVWPLVFAVFNGIIFANILSNEYTMGMLLRRRYYQPRYMQDDNGMDRSPGYELDQMKQGSFTIALVLLLDATVVYFCAIYLEEEIVRHNALDEVPTNKHVTAQVSRRLDVLLRRGPRPRVTIFLSVLLLLSVAFSTFGLVYCGIWLFSLTAKAETLCAPEAVGSTYDVPIAGIPDGLQEWARDVNHYDIWSTRRGIVRMVDGTTYFSADRPYVYAFNESGKQTALLPTLTSIHPDGSVHFHPKVRNIHEFVHVVGKNQLDSKGFCCVYTDEKDANVRIFNAFSYGASRPAASSSSLLCVTLPEGSNDAVFQTFSFSELISHTSPRMSDPVSLATASFNNELWVSTLGYHMGRDDGFNQSFEGPVKDFYKFNPSTKLLPEAVVSYAWNRSMVYYPDDQKQYCISWTRGIELSVLASVPLFASFWLYKVRSMPSGVVPACVACVGLLNHIDVAFSMALSCVAAFASLLVLLETVEGPVPVEREAWIWILYTIPVSILLLGDTSWYVELSIILPLVCIAGFVLDQPVTYLVGWIGGLTATCTGMALLWVHQYSDGLRAITLGILCGVGTATCGFHIMRYRSYALYYLRQAVAATTSVNRRSE
jgi:hypothetical protein